MYLIYMISQSRANEEWHLSSMGFENEIPTKAEGESIGFYQDTIHARLYVLDQKKGESILICKK